MQSIPSLGGVLLDWLPVISAGLRTWYRGNVHFHGNIGSSDVRPRIARRYLVLADDLAGKVVGLGMSTSAWHQLSYTVDRKKVTYRICQTPRVSPSLVFKWKFRVLYAIYQAGSLSFIMKRGLRASPYRSGLSYFAFKGHGTQCRKTNLSGQWVVCTSTLRRDVLPLEPGDDE
jgi:hypothetical protein